MIQATPHQAPQRQIGRKRTPATDVRTLERNRLRADLIAINPHCDNCGRRLQMMLPNRPDYASLVCGRLSCQRCPRIVHALAVVEGRVPQ